MTRVKAEKQEAAIGDEAPRTYKVSYLGLTDIRCLGPLFLDQAALNRGTCELYSASGAVFKYKVPPRLRLGFSWFQVS